MKKLLIMMVSFTLMMSVVSVYASDQSDIQAEQISQEDATNLALIATAIAHGLGSGIATGILIDPQSSYGTISAVTCTTVPLYTYLYSKYKKAAVDEKIWMVEIGFACGTAAGIAAGIVLRAVITAVLEQSVKELKLRWCAATSAK